LSALHDTLLLLVPSGLSVCQLPLPTSVARESVQVSTRSVLDLNSAHAGDHLVSCSDSTICVASRNVAWVALNQGTSISRSKFAWKQFNLPQQITSLDCANDTLAIGDRSGNIRLYFDLSESTKKDKLPTESIINWHQSPVSSLRFSHSGKTLLILSFSYLQVCFLSREAGKMFW